MTAPIHAQLIGSDTCTALGITVRAYTPVIEICRRLVTAGHDPELALEAWRGDVLCLRIRLIGEAAELEVNARGNEFRRLHPADAALPIAPINPEVVRPREAVRQ